jgi:protein TonB
MRRSNQPTSFFLIAFGIFLTLLFHGALIGGYLYWQSTRAQAAEQPPEHLEFERVELLMYGEVMPDPHELPVLPNPAPEERPEEVVQIHPEPQPEQTPEPQPEDVPVNRQHEETPPDQPRDSSRHNPNRPTNTEPLVGSREGVRGGTSLSAQALNNLWAPTVRAIQREMGRPGGVTDEEIQHLQASIHIYFNTDGRILRYTWENHSGNNQFDSAVERAVNAFRLGSRRLPLPTNQQALNQAIDAGITITVLPPD